MRTKHLHSQLNTSRLRCQGLCAFFCCPCFCCKVFSRAGEWMLTPFCCCWPDSLLSLRLKMRTGFRLKVKSRVARGSPLESLSLVPRVQYSKTAWLRYAVHVVYCYKSIPNSNTKAYNTHAQGKNELLMSLTYTGTRKQRSIQK